MKPEAQFIAAVIVGGYSRRFGSDKALANFGNGPNYLYICQELQKLEPIKVVLSGRAEQRNLFDPGFEFIPDRIGQGGPFAGLFSVQKKYNQIPTLLVACDYQSLIVEVIEDLLRAYQAGEQPGEFDAVAYKQAQGIYESTMALYAPGCLALMEQMIKASNKCSLQKLLQEANTKSLHSSIALPVDKDRPDLSHQNHQT